MVRGRLAERTKLEVQPKNCYNILGLKDLSPIIRREAWVPKVLNLDGPAILNANCGDSRQSTRGNKTNFHDVRASHLKPAIHYFQ